VVPYLRIVAGLIYLIVEAYAFPRVAAAKADAFLTFYPHIGFSKALMAPAAMGIAAALLLGPLGVAGFSPFSRRWWAKLVGIAVIATAMYAVSGDFASAKVNDWLSTHGYSPCPTEGLFGSDGHPWHRENTLWVRRNLYCPTAQ
jgi:hypothetical protein